jgi:toxin ParE1/3/4
VKLEWTRFALMDREKIFEYILKDNPRAAVDVDIDIGEQTAHLSDFPESGRLGRIAGTRELVINRTPYVVAYRIDGDVVRIFRVLHGAQAWPDEIQR